MMVNQLLVVETEKYTKVKVYYTPSNVVVLPHIASLRTIDGVCGHMGSTAYVQKYPLVYRNVSGWNCTSKVLMLKVTN